MTCPQCREWTGQDTLHCGRCGHSLIPRLPRRDRSGPLPPSPSQFPSTPGEQFVSRVSARDYIPGRHARAEVSRLDLRRLGRLEQAAGGATLVVLISLFLPWFCGTGPAVRGTEAHGYFALVVILAVLLAGYLILRSVWQKFPVSLPVRHETLVLGGTGLQLVLVLAGFLQLPAAGLHREAGAYLAMAAATAAVAAAAAATSPPAQRP